MQKLLSVAFWCAAAFAFVMAVLPHPPMLPGDPSDKIQHILAFAVLTMLGRLAYPGLPWWKLLLGLCLYGALIELVQEIPTLHRDSDIRDWIADTLSVVAVLGAMALLVRPRPREGGAAP